jgi:hypothetical protein
VRLSRGTRHQELHLSNPLVILISPTASQPRQLSMVSLKGRGMVSLKRRTQGGNVIGCVLSSYGHKDKSDVE